jgi:hypothetical protein
MADEANIGARETRKRRILGIVALTTGVSIAGILVVTDAPHLLRLIVFFPFWLGGLGLLQAKEKT